VGTVSPLQQTTTIPQNPISNRATNSTVTLSAESNTTPNSAITTTTTTTTITTTAAATAATAAKASSNSTKLLNSNRRDSSWRSSSSILPKLETDSSTSMATEDHQGGIPDSIRSIPEAMEITKTFNSKRRARRNKYSSKKVLNSRNHRRMPRSKIKRVSFKIFYNTGSNQETPNFGLSQDQSMYPGGTFQNGRCSGIARFNRTRRLHGEVRPTRCLHRFTYPSKFKTIFSLRKSGNDLPIQSTQLWLKCSSKNFFKNTSIRHRTFKKTRNTAGLLLGRHLSTVAGCTRSREDSLHGNRAFGIAGFHNKQEKKFIDTISHSGVSGFRVRYNVHEDQGSGIKNQETDAKNQAGNVTNNKVLSLGCKPSGEDYGDVTSSGRCPPTHQTHTEEFINQSPLKQPRLGKTMSIIYTGDRGVDMVENFLDEEKRITNSQATAEETKDHHNNRQFRHGLGSQFTDDTNLWVLDEKGRIIINQRKRTDEHLFCSEITRTKLQKLHNQGFDRQQDVYQIHYQGRRYSLSSPTRLCSEDTRYLQSVQFKCDIPTYPRNQQHCSRSVIKNKETIVREHNSEKIFSENPTEMGTIEDRHVRIETEYPTSNVLESETGPSSSRHGCLHPTLAIDRTICVPSLEADTTSTSTNQTKEDQKNRASDTLVANTILVPDVIGNEETIQTNVLQQRQKDDTSRMAVVRRAQQQKGLSQEEMEFLEGAQRSGTKKTYDNGWNIWVTWCQEHKIDFEEYHVQNVLKFLIDNQHYSTQHLNTIRSAIASVFKYIHPEEEPIALQPLIQEFFSSKRNQPVKVPAEHKLKTWDIDIVVKYLHYNFSDNEAISLKNLQLKTITLLCIATMARPRSDVGKIQYRDVILQHDDQGKLLGAIVYFRQPKEAQVKSCTMGIANDVTICPVVTLSLFIQRTIQLRTKLPTDHKLFLGFIEEESKVCSARSSTVANWVKETMKNAGVDTKLYGPHSIRSASSTKAVERGHTIEEVKEHANWSRNTQTFERFYYKPTTSLSLGSRITNSIFSTANLTTLEAGAEATEIVIGTPNNQNVAEAKAENVVNTHPTSWFSQLKNLF
jgi:hypothetical protein